MKKKIGMGILVAATVIVVLFAFSKNPIVSGNTEIPESYMEAVKAQVQGTYSRRLPLVPVYVRIDRYEEEKLFYTIYYFPFGSVGMSYAEEDGYNIEKPLSRLS